jgi:hypothetical protein
MNPFAAVVAGLAVLFVVLALAVFAIPVLALAYVALRVQDAAREEPDPRLGMKAAFHAVHSFSVLLVLVGLSILTVDLLNGALGGRPNAPGAPNPFGPPPAARAGDGPGAAKRTAAGLIVSGGLFGLTFWACLTRTNDAARRSVRRVFVGGRMALCLLVVLIAVTGLLVTLFQKTPDDGAMEALVGTLLVWLPAAGVHMALFAANMGAPRRPRRRPEPEDDEDRDDRRRRPEDDDEDREERPWRPADDR